MKTSSTSVAKSTKGRKPGRDAILAAIKAHAASKTYAEIAAMLGVARNLVIRVGRQAGFRKFYVSDEIRARRAHMRKVILAHARTHTLAQIGRMLGVTDERVRQLCEKWQIERRNFLYSPLRCMSQRQLRKLVRQPDKTLVEITAEVDVAPVTLRDELRRRGIESFTRRERDARLLKMGMRVCGHCRRTKPIEQFTRSTNHSSGYSNRCLECGRAYINARRKREAKAKQ